MFRMILPEKIYFMKTDDQECFLLWCCIIIHGDTFETYLDFSP